MSIDTWYPAGHNNWCSVNLTPKRFAFQVNSPASNELDFQSACDFTAQTLYQDWGDQPLYLSLSGGLDSEVIANTFVRNHIPFVPIILCVDNFNSAESQYAKSWCQQHNIDPLIKNLTIVEYVDIIKKYSIKISHSFFFNLQLFNSFNVGNISLRYL
jgi:asparagine synthetase B (glutamine-hydrolysing)